MELRPGYKQTDVGVIPEDWGVLPLGRLIHSVEYGSAAKSSATGRVPVLRMGNLQGGKIDWNDLVYTDNEIEIRKYSLVVGDVLFNRTNTIDLVGKTAIYKGERAAVFAGYLIRINSDKALLDSAYLNYVLNTEFSRKHSAKILSIAVGQANINGQKLKSYPVPLPPTKAEQEAIAEALSDADALIESLEQLLAKKRQIKQGAMQELLTGKKRLPGFSGEWEVGSIASVSAFVTKGSTPTTYGFNWVGDGILFLRSECVSAEGLDLAQSMFISEIAHAALHRGEVRAGDILMTITGNVGRVVLLAADFGAANINQHIARIRIVDRNVSFVFVFYWLSQAVVRTNYTLITTGQAYPQISLKQVRETLVPLPSLPEQTAIATILSDMDAEITALEAKLAKARQLKQGMMQELLTGRIRLV
jgi:type I restriction enzyme S subunit